MATRLDGCRHAGGTRTDYQEINAIDD